MYQNKHYFCDFLKILKDIFYPTEMEKCNIEYNRSFFKCFLLLVTNMSVK